MARSLRYRSMGYSLAPIRNVDFANLREKQITSSIMQQQADKVTNFALKTYEKAQIRKAQEMAVKDPEGVLSQYGGKKPLTSAGAAAFEQASVISAAKLETQARNDLSVLLTDWETNRKNPQDLQDKIDNLNTGYSSALQNLDPIAAAKLNMTLSVLGQSTMSDYIGKWSKWEDEKNQTDSLLGWNRRKKDGELFAANQGLTLSDDEFDSILAIDVANHRQYLEASKFSGDKVASMLLDYQEDIYAAQVIAKFNTAPDKNEFMDKVFEPATTKKDGLLRGLNRDAIKSLRTSFNRTIRSRNSESNSKLTVYNKEFTPIKQDMFKGYDVTTRLSELKQKVENEPDSNKKAEMMKDIQLYEVFGPEIKRVASMPVSEIDSNVLIIKNELKKNGVTASESLIMEALDKVSTEKKGDAKIVKDKITEIGNIIKANNTPDQKEINKLSAMVKGIDDPSVTEQYEELERLYNVVKNQDIVSIKSAVEDIENLKATFNQDGININEQAIIQTYQNIIKQKKSALAKDPVEYYQNQDKSFPEINMSNVIRKNTQDTGVINDAAKRYEYMVHKTMLEDGAVSFNILTKDESTQIFNELDSAPNATQKMTILNNIRTVFGDKSDELFSTMFNDSNQPTARIYSLVGELSGSNPTLATNILKGMEKEKTGQILTTDKFTKNDIKIKTQDLLNELHIGSDMKGSMLDAMYYSILNDGDIASNQFEKRLNEIAGGTGHPISGNGGIYEFDNHSVVVPKEVNKRELNSIMNNLEVSVFEQSLQSTPHYKNGEIFPIEKIIDDGVYLVNSGNPYMFFLTNEPIESDKPVRLYHDASDNKVLLDIRKLLNLNIEYLKSEELKVQEELIERIED